MKKVGFLVCNKYTINSIPFFLTTGVVTHLCHQNIKI
jgi:hypothetical protein